VKVKSRRRLFGTFGAMKKSPRKPRGLVPIGAAIVAGMGITFGIPAAANLVFAVYLRNAESENVIMNVHELYLFRTWSESLIRLAIATICVRLALSRGELRLRFLRRGRLTPVSLLVICGATVGLSVLGHLALPGFGPSSVDGWARGPNGRSIVTLQLGSLIVLAPLIEECVWRGWGFGGMQRYLGPPLAVAVVGITFVLAHQRTGDVLLLCGLAGWLQLLSCQYGLLGSITAHTVRNLVAVAFDYRWYFLSDPSAFEAWLTKYGGYVQFAAALVAILCCACLWRRDLVDARS
jgi:membrane protease YdiL (CAAX protease family)